MNRIIYISFFLIFIMNSDVLSQDTTALHKITIYDSLFYKRYNAYEKLIKYIFYVDDTIYNNRFLIYKETSILNHEKAHLESLKANDKYVFKNNKLFGIKNINGKIITPAKYSKFKKNKEGFFYAYNYDEKYWVLFNHSLDLITSSNYSDIFCKDYNKNICIIKKDDKYGVIDTTEKEIISPLYTKIQYIGDSLLLLINDKTSDLVTYNNKLFYQGENKKIEGINCFNKLNGSESYCKFKEKGKQGVIDNTGKVVIKPIYTDIKFVKFKNDNSEINAFLLYRHNSWSLWYKEKIILNEVNFSHPKLDNNSDFVLDLNFLIYKRLGDFGIITNENNNINLHLLKGDSLNPICSQPLGDYTLSHGNSNKYLGIKTNQDYIYVSKDSLWGICDLKGNMKILPNYQEIYYFNTSHSKEMFLAMKNGKWGLLDIEGHIIYDFIWNKLTLNKYHDEIITKSSDGYGILNRNGIQILKPIYETIKKVPLTPGNIYKIKKDGKWGLIDLSREFTTSEKKTTTETKNHSKAFPATTTLKGKRLLDCKYDEIQKFKFDRNSYFKFRKDTCWFLMRSNGKMIIDECSENINTLYFKNQRYLNVKTSNYCKILSIDGKSLFNSESKNIKQYGNTIYAQNKMGKWGILHSEGPVKLDYIYDDIKLLRNRNKTVVFAKIKLNGKYALIDKNGIIATKFEYKDIEYLSGDEYVSGHNIYYKVKKENKWGVIFINKVSFNKYNVIYKLDVIFNNIFINPTILSDKIMVNYNGKWGVYSNYMNPIIQPEFKYFIKISNTKYFALKNDFECGFVTNDKYIPLDNENEGKKEKLGFGFYKQRKGCYYGLLNSKDSLILPFEYLQIEKFNEKGKYYPYDMAKINKDGLWGYLLTTGRFLVEPQFDELRAYQENMARVMKDGKWGFIDSKGKLSIPLKYDSVKPFTNGKSRVSFNNKAFYIDINGNKNDISEKK